jgi:hypothetical protein
MRHFRSVAGPESCHDRAARSRFFQTSWFRAVIAWNWDALTVPSLGWVLLDRCYFNAHLSQTEAQGLGMEKAVEAGSRLHQSMPLMYRW